jgi:hypothetical protein
VLETVPEILEWGDASAAHAGLLHAHKDRLLGHYEERLARFVKARVGTRLARLSGELPGGSLDRILAAPETVNKLLFEPPTHFRHFLHAVIAEHRVLGNPVDQPEPVWTALFDYHCPPLGEGTPDGASTPVAAPRLANGAPLDFASPQAEASYFPISGPTRPPEPHEREIARSRLDQALDAIMAVRPPAHEMVSRYVQTIVVRKDPDEQYMVTCSYDHWTGKMGLTNIHLPRFGLARIVDGLVHEAIHSFLYVLEEGRPFFESEEVGNTLGLVSPWSGRVLRYHTFLHACYVWLGLWRFWEAAFAAGFEPADDARAMLEHARSGFTKPELGDRIRDLAPSLTEHARPLLRLTEAIHERS